MKTALIGYSGFVGHNLSQQFEFDDKYNSTNIGDIQNKEYDLVVCSAIPASMWMANNFPEKDRANIDDLLNILKTVKASQFILISSTAVFKTSAQNVDENNKEFEDKLAYGVNRRYAEEVIETLFDNHFIMRIPALFGDSLKKNFIYDLLNQEPSFFPSAVFEDISKKLTIEEDKLLRQYYEEDKEKSIYSFNKEKAIKEQKRKAVLDILKAVGFTSLNFTHSESAFQFYSLYNLWQDIQIAINNDIKTLHLCSEPIKAKEVAKQCFGLDFVNDTGKEPFDYDMRSLHAKLWNKEGCYQYTKDDVFSELTAFFNNQRGA